MNDDIRWTYSTHQEIVEKSAEKEIYISPPTVADPLKPHGFKKREMSRCGTIKDVENRDEQFINIDRLRNIYTREGEPVVSVDGKKKNRSAVCIEKVKSIQQHPLKYMIIALLPCGPVYPHLTVSLISTGIKPVSI